MDPRLDLAAGVLRDPKFRKRYGPTLGFDSTVPKWQIGDVLR